MISKYKLRQAGWASVCALLLAACSEKASQPIAVQEPKFVKLTEVQEVPALDEFTFPAAVSAVKTVDLSFEVSGRLVQTDIVEGSDVRQGHLLATIDPEPFERRVAEQRTRLNQARRELDRIERMFARQLVSQSVLDSTQTAFELAEIDLKNAQQDLGYTRLIAPFNAKISRRLVENNSVVSAGTPVAQLQDLSKVYFNINVPERLLTANIGRGIARAEARLINQPDNWFSVEYVEHRTQPDPISQTYEVVFAMQPNAQLRVTPGARAIVRVNLAGTPYTEGLVVPITALVGDKQAGFKVWKYQPAKGVVQAVDVNVVHVEENLVVLLSELNAGDRIVAAGASLMREGLQVKPFEMER
ncbi:efflux RND transporter periplasmic adaptor subunit [Alteromonas aestuariivivens]|uniref:Efflux RND transporter periplasmic adaptor subunit n=1 Tax=Alteromonas aestuariivivens TaxID=1938339 RepID=A0A3D8M3C4_9ALTE|nr:efflux RND transporter periplasmic adaptor subunit [Alteromonas aestuariivivens]RDV24237.1 efflux RND transporter periplasmic adaptor subunit [Alteromonas aestuariivivens]